MTDFEVDIVPEVLIDSIGDWNYNINEGKAKLEKNYEKKWVKMV